MYATTTLLGEKQLVQTDNSAFRTRISYLVTTLQLSLKITNDAVMSHRSADCEQSYIKLLLRSSTTNDHTYKISLQSIKNCNKFDPQTF